MSLSGADRLHAGVRDEPDHHDPGRGLHQPRGGVPDRRGAAAGGHGRGGVLELARPQRAAQLAASRTHLQREAFSYI